MIFSEEGNYMEGGKNLPIKEKKRRKSCNTET